MAFENPDTALRVARRAERVIQACVGLSPTRRAAALAFVSEKRHDSAVDPKMRAAACWLALELGSDDAGGLGETIEWMFRTNMERDNVRPEFEDFLGFLCARAESLTPLHLTRAYDVLINCLAATHDYSALKSIGELFEIGGRLNPEQTARSWDKLIEILEATDDPNVAWAARNGLMPIAGKLPLGKYTEGWISLLRTLEASTNRDTLGSVGEVLEAIAPRISAEQVKFGGDVLVTIFEEPYDRNDTYWAAGHVLAAIAPRLNDEQVARAANALITVLEKAQGLEAKQAATDTLAALASRLTTEHVNRCIEATIHALENTQDNYLVNALGEELLALQARISPEQRIRGFVTLMDIVIAPESDRYVRRTAGKAIVALASALNKDELGRLFDDLTHVIETGQEPDVLAVTGEIVRKLAPRFGAEQIQRIRNAVNKAIEHSPECNELRYARVAILAQSAITGIDQRYQVWTSLINILEESDDTQEIEIAGEAIVASTTLLTSEEAIRGAELLIRMLETPRNSSIVRAASLGLIGLSPKLNADQVSRIRQTLLRFVEQYKFDDAEPRKLDAILELVVTPQLLDPESRTRIVAALHNECRCHYLIKNLPTLAPQLDPPEGEGLALSILQELLSIETNSADSDLLSSRNRNWIKTVAPAVHKPRQIAEMLAHPGAVGLFREALLMRLDELVNYGGEHVLLPWPIPESNEEISTSPKSETGNFGGVPLYRASVAPPVRRFQTIHDAAAWIQKHWPGYDFEKVPEVPYRDEY